MKDSILHSALIAIAFTMIAARTIDERHAAPEPTMTQGDRLKKMEKTVVTANRLYSNITLAAAAVH